MVGEKFWKLHGLRVLLTLENCMGSGHPQFPKCFKGLIHAQR